MPTTKHLPIAAVLAAMLTFSEAPASAAMLIEEAWTALPAYEHGQDMAPLLAIDRAVIEAMADPDARAALAARLAKLLEDPLATPASKQYVCLQLRQIGTSAEVPILAEALAAAETSEMARHALEAVPGGESLAALRAGLDKLQGPALVGVIHSLGARADAQAVPTLTTLAGHDDGQVTAAAIRALGSIADEPSTAFLLARTEAATMPTPHDLAAALLHCGHARAVSGNRSSAERIYRNLSEAGQPAGVRTAAFEGLLALHEGPVGETVSRWLAADDPAQRRVAARHLASLSDAQLDALLDRLASFDGPTQTLVLRFSVERKGGAVSELALELVRSENEGARQAGVRILGEAGDPASLPVLIDAMSDGGAVAAAAGDALLKLPRAEVGPALLEALDTRPAIRAPLVDTLGRMTYYEAIDPLIELAQEDDPETYTLALQGLRAIADPDQHDIPRLVKLLLRSRPGRHADEVERTILIVCEKLPPDADRAEPVLHSLRGVPESDAPKYLPLLGRLGGAEAHRRIDAGLAHADASVREAAVRALCNWPDATVADRLLGIARDDENRTFQRWALRAFVRVVSLQSDRPDAETLTMLQDAMHLAEHDDDRRLVLERAGNVRTMEAVRWISPHLDEPALAQAACRALVELAHHRFLRHPNMEQFRPILKRIIQMADDPAVAERAARYEQGL